MELPEYVEKCRQITDTWLSRMQFSLDSKIHRCIISVWKRTKTFTADRVIEIATNIYNSDCQRSIMQTLSTASAAATATQQGSTQVHKLQEKHREDGKSRKEHDKDNTSQDKVGMKRQDCYCCVARPAHPKSKCPAKDVTCHSCGKEGHY